MKPFMVPTSTGTSDSDMRSIACRAFLVRFFRRLILIFAFAFLPNSSLRGGVDANGNETPSATDSKSTVAEGKDGKSPAAAAATTTEETTEYKNWIEFGIGGTTTDGDRAQFEQEHHIVGDEVFGGITDMHYEHGVGEKATLSIDGHALWDISDYDIKVDLSQLNLAYIRGGFTEFRSWYDGNGGFFPHGDVWFPPAFPEMHIDRGDVWFELGLRIPNWPEITIHFSHLFRDGQKDSTIWGDTTLTGLIVNPARKIVPAYRDIDEHRDILAADASKTFGNTDVGIGMRWEHAENDDKLQLERGAGQLPPVVPAPGAQRFITQHEDNTIDDFTGHILSETRFTDNFWFTGGYAYSALSSDLTGTRIIGTHYNSMFGEPILTLQSNDHGFLNLAGISEVNEHVFNSNLFWIPLKDLNVIAGFRYTREDKDSSSTFLDTNTAANVLPFTPTNPKGGFHEVAPIPRAADTSDGLNNLAERLELRYTHIQNWLFYAEGEWEEEFGDVHEHEVSGALVRGVPVSSDQGAMNKDTSLLGQKYTVGATWYPMARLNLAAQYYYKAADYDNDFHSELATPTDVPPPLGAERNQRLIGQDWTTNDANIRITVRPKLPETLGTLSLISRYDFMQSYISGKWGVSPAGPPPAVTPPPPAIPTGTVLNEEWTGMVTSHVISESMTWNPCARFYLQGIGSYVLNQTETPASKINLIPNTSPTVVDFRNDYWTVTGAAGYVLDELTDLRADYTFYRANDYFKNTRVALPYGMGATEHTVTATASRQITKQIRLTLQYHYFNYQDETFGGHNDYEAHSVFSGLQYRF
jgi:hypothetical protein